MHGHHGKLLHVDLSTGTAEPRELSPEDASRFVGGRGLGAKLLWDLLPEPGVSASAPEAPLMFLPGPMTGFPLISASRTCVVTKSPCTWPAGAPRDGASTVSYSNMGGFLGPEIRFAGYDGLVITGRAAEPVVLIIDDDQVELREAGDYWGMGTEAFDQRFSEDLGDHRYRTAYIGPAGENQVTYAALLHTAARAAARGVGCVMGAKQLKAVAVRGSQLPTVADHARFIHHLDRGRREHRGLPGGIYKHIIRKYGTAYGLTTISAAGRMAVRNYREGTFVDAAEIGGRLSKETVWVKNEACRYCALSCKKSGVIRTGPWAGRVVHDGPEYETGAMFGSNLLVSDLCGLLAAIGDADDLGVDIISAGNVIGFLMECFEKALVDQAFLDGLDLRWGNVEAIVAMLHKIAHREGVGELAAQGVRAVSEAVGQGTEAFAIHVKGMEFAGHNVHHQPAMALSYATSSRGACHIAGGSADEQDYIAAADCTGVCLFATNAGHGAYPGLKARDFADLIGAATGEDWTAERFLETGRRVVTLEKAFNYREGFRRADDTVPARFFDEPLTIGRKKGEVLDRAELAALLDDYYDERGWDLQTTRPHDPTLAGLGLEFVDLPS